MIRLDTEHPWLSMEDLSKLWGVTDQTIRKLIETGQLRAFKIGRQFRITHDDIQAYLQSVQTK